MNADEVMDNIRSVYERSGMTLNKLGEGLGYDGPTAKKRAWYLLNRTSDHQRCSPSPMSWKSRTTNQ